MDRPRGEDTAVATVMAADAAGRMLHCFVEQSIPIQGQDYGLLSPVDMPAHLCRWPADDAAPELINDPHQYPQVLEELDMALQEQELCLVRSAGLLTVAGELDNMDWEDDDDSDGVEAPMNGSDPPRQSVATGETDLETHVLLASVHHGGMEFGLYGSLEPCFLLARLETGAAQLLAPDELARLQPLVEAALLADGEEVRS